MIYTVNIKERFDKNANNGIMLEVHSHDDLVNLISLLAYNQAEYHSLEIKITAAPEKVEQK